MKPSSCAPRRGLRRAWAGRFWPPLFVLLCRLLMRGQRWAVARTTSAADRQLQRLPGGEVVRASRLPGLLGRLVTILCAAAGLLVAYWWLSFVLRSFPYTRPWGEALRGFLLERLTQFAESMVGAIPELFTVLLIVVVTRLAMKPAGLVFEAVEHGHANFPGVHPDTAPTTRRITMALLWLFALALAYPHLPGSDTDAFKGVSVFVGLMLSLGSSGIVNQVMSGLTMTYSRALTKGEFVRIGDVEGTVTQLGMLSTKLQTSRREELTIPNAVVISAVTTNYSRLQREAGVFVPPSRSATMRHGDRRTRCWRWLRSARPASAATRRRACDRPAYRIFMSATRCSCASRIRRPRCSCSTRCTPTFRTRSMNTASRSCRPTTKPIRADRRSCRPTNGSRRQPPQPGRTPG